MNNIGNKVVQTTQQTAQQMAQKTAQQAQFEIGQATQSAADQLGFQPKSENYNRQSTATSMATSIKETGYDQASIAAKDQADLARLKRRLAEMINQSQSEAEQRRVELTQQYQQNPISPQKPESAPVSLPQGKAKRGFTGLQARVKSVMSNKGERRGSKD